MSEINNELSNNRFYDVLYSRRSIRQFTSDKVPREVIEAAIKAGSYAPSVTNRQPWRFCVLSNQDNIIKIADMATDKLFKIAKIAYDRGDTGIASAIENFDRYATLFRDAPTLILALTDGYKTRLTEYLDTTEFKGKWFEEGMKSCCMAAQNIVLSLWEAGYGSCMMSAPINLAEEEIKNFLGISPNESIAMLIAVGKAVKVPAAPARKSLEEIVSWYD